MNSAFGICVSERVQFHTNKKGKVAWIFRRCGSIRNDISIKMPAMQKQRYVRSKRNAAQKKTETKRKKQMIKSVDVIVCYF